jgi:O-methyltransferase
VSRRGVLRRIAARRGPSGVTDAPAPPLSEEDRRIIEAALPYTMTGVPRLQGLIDAVRYCIRRDVPGGFAECGVWRGGSILATILTLQEHGVHDRDIYLYDTFEGMTEPDPQDEEAVREEWSRARSRGERPWQHLFGEDSFNEADVRATILGSGYPSERIHFVRGPVEETIPEHAPAELALLRLDTDWYGSTRHELEHLYPLLSDGGVLIIDDYGHFEGCARAVDEYFAEHAKPVLLSRVDYTGRMAIKH